MDNYQDYKWKFNKIENPEERNFDDSLETFYKLGIDGLVRENIQNSLDSFLDFSTNPVIVKIETGSVETSALPGIEEIIDRVQALEGKNDYTKETIKHMQNKVAQTSVKYISFEDLNTKGLTNARNGQSNSKNDTWGIYAYSKAHHAEDSNLDNESIRGGSHGVGKIASNAASDLFLMFFSNCDVNGDQHLGGTVKLVEHCINDQWYRSSGYFTDVIVENNKKKFVPFENGFSKLFEKNERGLKIVIPFLRDEYNDEDSIIKSVCDNFFVAILEKKLVVFVNDTTIDDETILEFMGDENYYEQDTSRRNKVFTPTYVRTYLNTKPRDVIVDNGSKLYKFRLFFLQDDNIRVGRVAIVRTIGMKIEDFKVDNYVRKPYNAVIIGGVEEDRYLKSLENVAHNSITYEHIKNPLLRHQAREFIKSLKKELIKVIIEEIDEKLNTDGEYDTSDLLYTYEQAFKDALKEAGKPLEVNNGPKKITVVQSPPSSNQGIKGNNKKRKPSSGGKDSGGTPRSKDENKERKSRAFKVNSNNVYHLLLEDKEVVQFDFSDDSFLSNASKMNLRISIVDGDGNIISDEFDLDDNYRFIFDMNSSKPLNFDKKVIKDISISNSQSNLELKIKPKFNRSLKFVYYVEVQNDL